MGKLRKELSDAIDRAVIMNLLTANENWTKVKLRTKTNEDLVINKWCNENLEGAWMQLFEEYIFESERDAALFALRWA